jgi:hypothetical protein
MPAVEHQSHTVRKFIHVLSADQERLDAQLLEPDVWLRIDAAAHNADHLCGELEGRTLKRDATGSDVEAEPEVYFIYALASACELAPKWTAYQCG